MLKLILYIPAIVLGAWVATHNWTWIATVVIFFVFGYVVCYLNAWTGRQQLSRQQKAQKAGTDKS